MAKRRALVLFVAVGFLVALSFAFFVSPYASSEPDGLERVAIDKGFDGQARDHALADGPLADYALEGVDNEKLSKGLAGVIGVVVCFAVGAGVILAVRALRPKRPPAGATS